MDIDEDKMLDVDVEEAITIALHDESTKEQEDILNNNNNNNNDVVDLNEKVQIPTTAELPGDPMMTQATHCECI